MLTHALTPCASGSNVACETSKAFVLIEARIVLQYIKRFVQEDGGFYFNTSKPEILLYLQYNISILHPQAEGDQ